MQNVLLIAIISLLFTGCNNPGADSNNNQEPDFADPIHYDTNEKSKQPYNDHDRPMKKYLQSDEKGVGRGGTEQNIFDTNEAREIVQKLALREDVKQTQVATNDDQIAVFVLLHDYQDQHIAKSLEEDIREISPNKEIFVYTDKVHWNRLNDLDSTIKARQMGDNLEQFLEKHFNLDIKD